MYATSFLDDAEPLLQGECILVKFPVPLNIDPYTFAGDQFAFIRSSVLRDDGSYDINVYPIISFSNHGGALLPGYNALPPGVQALLIPLPPLSTRYPTPITFGNPINLIGGFSLDADSWLLVNPYRFILPENSEFRRWTPRVHLSHKRLHQIDSYRNSLQNPLAATNDENGQAPLASDVGSTVRERRRGEGGGGRRGGSAGRDLATLAPEELEYLVTEDVDDDPRGANATFKDDLMLLAGPDDDGLCKRDLTKLLQAEGKEKQEQSVARVRDWLHLK